MASSSSSDTDASKKALQAEVVACKQRWADEIKLVKAGKDVPTAPLPLAVARTIQRPESAALYDVDELTVKLWVDALDTKDPMPVHVEVISPQLPESLRPKIAAVVDERWRRELRARGEGKGFLLEKLLGWAEGAYADLIGTDPAYVDTYEGCDDEGMTIRRYSIQEPPPEPVDVGDEDDDEDDDSSDEEAGDTSLDTEADRLARIRIKAEEEAERLYREERRKEAEEARQRGDEPIRMNGKKEQEEARKQKEAKKGSRMRKEGNKHNKFDAEAAGKTKNKKNGLMH